MARVGFSNSTGFMIDAFRLNVCVRCLFSCFIYSNIYSFFVNFYRAVISIRSFIKVSSNKSADAFRCCAFLILHIFRPCNIPKVAKFVIISNSVYMVYMVFRKISCHIKPSKSMSLVSFPINCNSRITSCCIDVFHDEPAPHSVSFINSNILCKNTGIRVIMKDFFKSFLRKHLILRNSNLSVVGNRLITAVERLANPVPTIGIIT